MNETTNTNGGGLTADAAGDAALDRAAGAAVGSAVCDAPGAGPAGPTERRRTPRLRRVAAAVLAAILLGATVLVLVDADPASAQTGTSDVRIVARRLADGRVEFGLQQRLSGSWGERMLPDRRFFPADATVGRWLTSSPLDIPAAEIRIAARRLRDGRVEFGLQQRLSGSWGERMLPDRRFFPAGATVGRWLTSSSQRLGGNGRETTDPLGLVAGFELTSAYSLGRDIWDVWLCDTPSGRLFYEDRDARFNPANYANAFRQRVAPWFDWQSGGAYEPVFRPAGVVRAPGAEPEACTDAVAEATSRNDADGALIVSARQELSEEGAVGYGWCGLYSRRSWPENRRSVVVYADAYKAPNVVAHELGHALCWPHSFTGSSLNDDGSVWQYDNPMDQMSWAWADLPDESSGSGTLTVGTIAFNRYAAGWIDAGEVAIHRPGTTRDYRLAPPGESGTQLLVLADPGTGTDGVLAALGARKRGAGGSSRHDSGLGDDGIEIYWIDQTAQGCDMPDRGTCHGLERRTVPVDSVPFGTGHVINEGGSFWVISGYEVSVGEYSSNSNTYPVSVRPADLSSWTYGQDPVAGAWSEAFLHSDRHDLASPYGLGTLNVNCVGGVVNASVYLWSDYIDLDHYLDHYLDDEAWVGVATVSYRFGDFGAAVTTPWVLSTNGQGAFAPADAIPALLADLTSATEPLHITLRISDGTEVGTITFPASRGTENIDRVLRDCGAGAGREIPVSDWTVGEYDGDALYGPLPYAILVSFEHNLAAPFDAEPAALFLDCRVDNGALRVFASMYLGGLTVHGDRNGDVPVAYRFDSGAINRRDWFSPTEGQEFVFMPVNDYEHFRYDLQRRDRLTLRLSDARGNEIGTVTFPSLAGAERAISHVQDGCR